jgi:hypothetical protein
LRWPEQDSPIDGAAAIVEAYVVQDLLGGAVQPRFENFLITTPAHRWFMDHLIKNTVNIAIGSQTEQFREAAGRQLQSSSRLLRQADGAQSSDESRSTKQIQRLIPCPAAMD